MTDRWSGQPDSTRIRSIQWDSSWPELAGDSDRSRLLSYLEERFGIPMEEFRNHLIFKKNRSYWMLMNSSQILRASQLKVRITGMKMFQEVGEFIKPTTRFVQMFGYKATRAILEIGEQELRELAADKYLHIDMGIDNGYVILSIENIILGLGLLINGTVRTQIPRRESLYSIKEKQSRN